MYLTVTVRNADDLSLLSCRFYQKKNINKISQFVVVLPPISLYKNDCFIKNTKSTYSINFAILSRRLDEYIYIMCLKKLLL